MEGLPSVIKEVDILGKIYNVREVKDMASVDDAVGKCKPEACQIWVAKDQHAQQQRDTLLHEILHGVWSEMGITEDVKEEQEETVVRRMGTGLLYVIRHNPELLELLTME
jgi:hypothetical protein